MNIEEAIMLEDTDYVAGYLAECNKELLRGNVKNAWCLKLKALFLLAHHPKGE